MAAGGRFSYSGDSKQNQLILKQTNESLGDRFANTLPGLLTIIIAAHRGKIQHGQPDLRINK